MRKDKLIIKKEKGYSAKAMALNTPSRDVNIEFNIKYMLPQKDVPEKEKEIRARIKEWFKSSTVLDNKYLLVVVNRPETYKYLDKVRSMCFYIEISSLTIDMVECGGKGPGSFLDLFGDELDRLVTFFGIE
jgi:hypothetical protein